ncbi:MAG TPA: D-alanyl-D-alanine carboxypeptidase family protein [Bacilli bacterium]|nr:D-alanyl-D-alanine carboxypeptidase family protein [Bacilli bacterium]
MSFKHTCTALLCSAALLFGTAAAPALAAEKKETAKPIRVDLAKEARSAVLMDAATGTILFDKNSNEKLPPASVTKVMTMLLIMEAVDNGKVKWNDKIRTSEYAASMGGSQIFLEPGEEMTLSEMFKGIAVASANDGAVAVAEHLAGSEEAFVEMMNERAKQLGATHTHFSNVNGLPTENHYTTAHDIALMSRELLKHEAVTKYTSIYEDHLRKSSEKPFWLVNTNKLVKFYSGMDGLKTGYTTEAKYCLSATAKRNGFRVIAVVMGEPTSPKRNAEISQMMDYAFANYKSDVFFKAGDTVDKILIDKGEVRELPMVAGDTVGVLMKKGEKKEGYQREIVFNDVQAPIKKGQVIGQILVKKEGKVVAKTDLVAPRDVNEASMWELFKRTVISWMTFGG